MGISLWWVVWCSFMGVEPSFSWVCKRRRGFYLPRLKWLVVLWLCRMGLLRPFRRRRSRFHLLSIPWFLHVHEGFFKKVGSMVFYFFSMFLDFLETSTCHFGNWLLKRICNHRFVIHRMLYIENDCLLSLMTEKIIYIKHHRVHDVFFNGRKRYAYAIKQHER